MATQVEYALMAGASYISTHDEVNLFPKPEDWDAIEIKGVSFAFGFPTIMFA